MTGPIVEEGPSFVPVPTGGCYSNQALNFGSLVSCGITSISVSPSSFKGAVESGAGAWSLDGSPIGFSYTDDFASAGIKITVSGSGPWCGTSTAGQITITTSGCNGNTATLSNFSALIAHELGHQVGFTSNYHSGQDATSGHCISHLPDDLTRINRTACPFERTFLATMQQSGGPTVAHDKHFHTGLTGPIGVVTLDVGQSVAIGPTGVRLDDVNGSLCPPYEDELGVIRTPTFWDRCNLEAGLSGSIGYTASGGVSTAGWNGSTLSVTGVSRGPAGVTFRLLSSDPSYYLSASPIDYGAPLVVLAPGIAINAGQGQSGNVNTALPTPIKVRVMDGGVAPIAGRVVTFAPGAGSGTVSQGSVTTDADGYAAVTWTLGANSSQSVVATLTGPTVASVTFTATGITPPTPADLRVTSITGPSSIPLYATSAIGYTLNVRNHGGTTVPGGLPYLISIAMSSDAAYSANDPRVFGGSGPAPLAPYNTLGDAGLTSVSFAPPASAVPGTVYLVANLDTTNVIAEGNEGNNTGASNAITLTANGDMRVDGISGPASTSPGATFTVPVIVKNHGTDPARPAKVKVYLSSDNVLSAGDSVIGSLTDTPLMTTGVIRTENVSVTIPAGMPLSSYYLIAKVDADSTVYESNEGNNSLVRPTQITVATPTYADLTVLGMIPQIEEAYYGNSYQWIKGSARNAGTASTPGNWVGRLYLSGDQTWDAGDILVASTTFGSLAPSTNVSIATTAGVPGSAGGYYYLIYKVDATGVVAESNEGNNVAVSANPIYVEGLP